MSSGLQRAEVSSPASRIRGSTESANTPCPADGLAYALSTPPIISIAGTNARILSHSFALPLHNPTVLDFRSSANRGACTPPAEERNALRPPTDRYRTSRSASFSPLLAQSGHAGRVARCPLSGVKRTSARELTTVTVQQEGLTAIQLALPPSACGPRSGWHNNPEDHSGLRKMPVSETADRKAHNPADGCDRHHVLADCRSCSYSFYLFD